MKIEHNSHSLFCRTPFGAAPCVSKVILRLFVENTAWPDGVYIKYSADDKKMSKKMHYHSSVAGNYVYEATLDMPPQPCLLFYHFQIQLGANVIYYGNNSDRMGGIGQEYQKEPIPYQITVYDSSYKTPDWMKGGIMYQIFCDRFYKSENYDNLGMRGDIIARNWGEVPYHTPEQFGGEYLANDFYGGSLEGVIEKLDYIAGLGISVIYLNPIFMAYSNHKYDTGDYEKIDPMFGDEKIFVRLCEEAHKRGMKIILDGVFNHTGSDSKYFNKKGSYDSVGAYQSTSSPYSDWYKFENYPDKYESWWGVKTLPSVNEDSKSYQQYILTDENSIIKKWLRLGADGWRLDVVDELPSDFVETLRREAKSVKSDAAVIGEVWEDASNKTSYGVLRKYLGGNQLDSAMNYPLKNAMIDFVLEKIDAYTFNRRIYSLYENYPHEAFMAMMNFLSSHDTMRIFTAMADVPTNLSRPAQAGYTLSCEQRSLAEKRFRLIYELLMYMPGMPSIFYGDEIMAEGFGDPFCRACFDWSKANGEVCEFFKNIIYKRRNSDAFMSGSFDIVYGEGPVCGFVRMTDIDFKLVLVNTSHTSGWYAPVEIGKLGAVSLSREGEMHTSENGRFTLHIEPMSIKVYDMATEGDE